MMMESHEFYLKRCLELAIKGIGEVAPNPMVGSVIVYDHKIIGEGYHQHYGKAHAEVNAIASVKQKDLLAKSTLYVNLEPCSHFGKTPPCADLIIASKIPKVVIGMRDPFSKVNGEGIAKLKHADIEVIENICEKECVELNKRFITYHQKQRPYIILKWAESKDGFIGRIGERIAISGELSQVISHKWRSEEQAILISAKTMKNDAASLTNRLWTGKSPTRIIIDRSGILSEKDIVVSTESKTILLRRKDTPTFNNCSTILIDSLNFDGNQLMYELYKLNIQSVIVEGGATLLQHFINENLWDEVRQIKSDKVISNGVNAPQITIKPTFTEKVGDDKIQYFIH
jgi:diaminohydroxyphosphoribosylaminopyrimidine deaminase / 5-amino-6-(5-phosphoribosylamino)uracil reductase